MIDPILSLAISMHSNRGVYAILLGSGVSRSAAIPTGWEVLEDLIRKVAQLQNESAESDPSAWFHSKYGTDPTYSRLLEDLGKSAAERQQILRNYFEPSDEERERELKAPTPAHRSIAAMVASGHIRIIVTTNFDRLMEQALEAVGVVPVVIASPDASEGALPLAHSRCTVIKVHGDYLDTRIRNSSPELATYDPRMDALLDRVFDEYGLIVCGWSAEWDVALRAALERCRNHRFACYWTQRGKLGSAAEGLSNLRRASTVVIRDADTFFSDLSAKVRALEDIDAPHPLSVAVAVAQTKRLLSEPRFQIPLTDLVTAEVGLVRRELLSDRLPISGPFDAESIVRRVAILEALTQVSMSIFASGCFFGRPEHREIWKRALEHAGSIPGPTGGYNDAMERLRWYPALLMSYGASLGAIAAGDYETLSHVLTRSRAIWNDRERPLIHVLNMKAQEEVFGLIPEVNGRRMPRSQHLAAILRQPLAFCLTDDIRYSRAFDRLEYLLSLMWLEEQGVMFVPLGRFSIRSWSGSDWSIDREIRDELEASGEAWPPLRAGLFRGDLDRVRAAMEACAPLIRS